MKKFVYVFIAALTATFVMSAAACDSNVPANTEKPVVSEPSKVVSEISETSETSEISEISETSEVSDVSEESVESSAPETSTVSKDEESAATVSKTYLYDSLEEYVADPTIQSAMASSSTDEITCGIEIEGDDTLVIKYTYQTEIDEEQLPMMGELLLEQLQNYDSMFTTMKQEIQTYVNVEDPHIKMAYYTMDGTLIAEYEPENY